MELNLDQTTLGQVVNQVSQFAGPKCFLFELHRKSLLVWIISYMYYQNELFVHKNNVRRTGTLVLISSLLVLISSLNAKSTTQHYAIFPWNFPVLKLIYSLWSYPQFKATEKKA